VRQPLPPDPDLTLCFGTSASSRTVAELGSDPRATVVYGHDSAAAFVVLAGRTAVVDSITVRQRRVVPTWYAFWREGPTSTDVAVCQTLSSHTADSIPTPHTRLHPRTGLAMPPYTAKSMADSFRTVRKNTV
jgi:hypothetical protein